MKAKVGILTFLFLAGLIFILVATFNYVVDPMCYYQCEKLDVTKIHVNTYYRVGQTVLAHPDTEVVLIGSSRGETTSPFWLEKVTGRKSLNLAVGGTELQAKFAFLNIALQNNPIKQVIWQADFFELIPELLDVKMKITEALRAYLGTDFQETKGVALVDRIISVIDHVTFEASVSRLKKKNQKPLDLGSASELEYEPCEKPEYKGEQDPEVFAKEIVSDWDRYRLSVFKYKASERYWDLFLQKMNDLSAKSIEVTILVAPYSPIFMKNLAKELPDIFAAHLAWVQKLVALRIPHIHVLNYFSGIPGDDGSVRFWGDGVHFTCKGAIIMLKPSLTQ